jgi:hypothetical protein
MQFFMGATNSKSKATWKLIVPDTAQESEMNALGIYLFPDLVNQTYKYNNNQYYADNHLGVHSKRQYYWMRNKEQYLCTLSKGHRLWNALFADVHYTVQIHPC